MGGWWLKKHSHKREYKKTWIGAGYAGKKKNEKFGSGGHFGLDSFGRYDVKPHGSGVARGSSGLLNDSGSRYRSTARRLPRGYYYDDSKDRKY